MNCIKEGAFIRFLTGAAQDISGADALALAEKLDLRGRGGAGFSVAEKMKVCKAFEGEKTVVCNAFGAREGLASWLAQNGARAVAAGLRLAAKAVGADKMVIYCNEADTAAQTALAAAAGADIQMLSAPDRLSCGEESILISVLNGQPPISHIRPPYPAESGLLIQSGETLAALAYAAATGESAGKLCYITGAVEKPGIVELKAGMTGQQLIDAAGGMKEGENFKTLILGDPLGRLTQELSQPVTELGGGQVTVLSDKACILHELASRMNTLYKQSCGKCTLCREGVRQMGMLIEAMTNGRGRQEEIDLLREVSEVIQEGASCGFGRLAAGMTLSGLEAFGGEFENHLRRKRCDAMVCKQYTSFHILGAKCQGCEKCLDVCPSDAIDGEEDFIHVINQVDCTRCGKCIEVCEYDAIVQAGAIKPRTPPKPIPVGTWRGR